MGCCGVSVANCRMLGSNSFFCSVCCISATKMAIGRIASGCGLTIATFPVIRFANSPGREFHVGNVEHPMISPIPRGIGLNVFCSWMLNFPIGFVHVFCAGKRVSSWYANAIVSMALSVACGPEAWNDMTNDCPVVCIVAYAISCVS